MFFLNWDYGKYKQSVPNKGVPYKTNCVQYLISGSQRPHSKRIDPVHADLDPGHEKKYNWSKIIWNVSMLINIQFVLGFFMQLILAQDRNVHEYPVVWSQLI